MATASTIRRIAAYAPSTATLAVVGAASVLPQLRFTFAQAAALVLLAGLVGLAKATTA